MSNVAAWFLKPFGLRWSWMESPDADRIIRSIAWLLLLAVAIAGVVLFLDIRQMRIGPLAFTAVGLICLTVGIVWHAFSPIEIAVGTTISTRGAIVPGDLANPVPPVPIPRRVTVQYVQPRLALLMRMSELLDSLTSTAREGQLPHDFTRGDTPESVIDKRERLGRQVVNELAALNRLVTDKAAEFPDITGIATWSFPRAFTNQRAIIDGIVRSSPDRRTLERRIDESDATQDWGRAMEELEKWVGERRKAVGDKRREIEGLEIAR
jgi:hypothetical protein